MIFTNEFKDIKYMKAHELKFFFGEDEYIVSILLVTI